MRSITVTFAILMFSPLALGHHSAAAFFDRSRIVEVEGTVSDVYWRNPHVSLTLDVVNDAGEIEAWELEAGTTNTLMRRGFTADSVSIGDRVTAAGAPSRRGEPAIFVSNVLLPNGEEYIIADREEPLRWTSASTADEMQVSVDELPGTGIFKVWGFRALYSLRNPLVLTPAAEAAIEAFNPRTDDPGLRCIPPGMPNAILNPYPMELIDGGDRIVQRIEEWDARRVIYLNEADVPSNLSPSHLGVSVGRWEGETLVVETTQIAFYLLDAIGTPMSESASLVERYTLSEDGASLRYEVIVTDPVNLAEPAIWDNTWAYRPGIEVSPFECTLRETVSPVYQ
ncbi:MAG: DUF6152 family protein [Candidatus Rariloculaceae bacterium]